MTKTATELIIRLKENDYLGENAQALRDLDFDTVLHELITVQNYIESLEAEFQYPNDSEEY